MEKELTNAAFIDSNNVNRTIQARLGWSLDWRRFRVHLEEKYACKQAFLYIGYIATNEKMYKRLQQDGYILVFKPVLFTKDGTPKGNVDADLVLGVMVEWDNYEKAVIATSDGDYYSLVEHLREKGKLEAVLSPAPPKSTSKLLHRVAGVQKGNYIRYLNDWKHQLEHKKR